MTTTTEETTTFVTTGRNRRNAVRMRNAIDAAGYLQYIGDKMVGRDGITTRPRWSSWDGFEYVRFKVDVIPGAEEKVKSVLDDAGVEYNRKR